MSGQSFLDKGLEQLEGGVSQVQNQVKKAPSDIAGAVISQITGKSSNDNGTNEAAQAQAQQHAATKANEDMVKEMYAPTDTQSEKLKPQKSEEETESQKKASEFIQEKIKEGHTPEEAQQLYSLRRKLHAEYFQRLTAYENAPPEERTAEKVTKEKENDEMRALDEKKKKDAPIDVQMGSNRTEQFPGASG